MLLTKVIALIAKIIVEIIALIAKVVALIEAIWRFYSLLLVSKYRLVT